MTQLPTGKIYMSVSGMIGAGKSSLATALGKKMQIHTYYEPVGDNPYLADFYKDMKTHSFAMQMYLLSARFEQQQQIVWSNESAIQDRTIYEDAIFAKMLSDTGMMSQRDYETYVKLFDMMSNYMRHPNVIVHLNVSPEESLRRIRSRKRECEDGITLEYLQALHMAYEKFLTDISKKIPVIKINYDEFKDVDEMAAIIEGEYNKIKISTIHNVD